MRSMMAAAILLAGCAVAMRVRAEDLSQAALLRNNMSKIYRITYATPRAKALKGRPLPKAETCASNWPNEEVIAPKVSIAGPAADDQCEVLALDPRKLSGFRTHGDEILCVVDPKVQKRFSAGKPSVQVEMRAEYRRVDISGVGKVIKKIGEHFNDENRKNEGLKVNPSGGRKRSAAAFRPYKKVEWRFEIGGKKKCKILQPDVEITEESLVDVTVHDDKNGSCDVSVSTLPFLVRVAQKVAKFKSPMDFGIRLNYPKRNKASFEKFEIRVVRIETFHMTDEGFRTAPTSSGGGRHAEPEDDNDDNSKNDDDIRPPPSSEQPEEAPVSEPPADDESVEQEEVAPASQESQPSEENEELPAEEQPADEVEQPAEEEEEEEEEEETAEAESADELQATSAPMQLRGRRQAVLDSS